MKGRVSAGKRLVQLWRSRSGAAAVEFAFILPLALVLLMALNDFTRAFNERKRITLISSVIADLVSSQSTSNGLPLSRLDDIVTGATAIMTPYPSDALRITVSAVQFTAKSDGSCCQAKVQWSVARRGSLRPCSVALAQVSGAVAPAPGNILSAMVDPSLLANSVSTQMIVVDVVNLYRPLFAELASFFTGAP